MELRVSTGNPGQNISPERILSPCIAEGHQAIMPLLSLIRLRRGASLLQLQMATLKELLVCKKLVLHFQRFKAQTSQAMQE